MLVTKINIPTTIQPHHFRHKTSLDFYVIDVNGAPIDDNLLLTALDAYWKQPKVVQYLIDKNKDFRTLTARDFSVSIRREESFGEDYTNRGLLLQEKYYVENDLVFQIDFDYNFDFTGGIAAQKATRTWYNNDGSVHDLMAYEDYYAPIFVIFSPKQNRKATHKRRESVIMMLESKIIALMQAKATNATEASQLVGIGASLLAEVSQETKMFEDSGIITYLVQKVESLKITYPFLNEEVVVNSGITVADFVADFLNYD